jgi:hypothetical protein
LNLFETAKRETSETAEGVKLLKQRQRETAEGVKLLKNRLRLIIRAKRDKKQPEGRCIILFTKAKVLFISHKCKENLHISINLYNFVGK